MPQMRQHVLPVTQDVPLLCTLTADERTQRSQENCPILTAFQRVEELEDGYALQYSAEQEWIQRLVTFVTQERACCPFLTFELAFEPDSGPIWLRLRGRAEVKDMLRDQWLNLQ